MGGSWLSCLKNALNKIRLMLISFHEEAEMIKTASVQKRVNFIDRSGWGGFEEDPEDDVGLEDDVDQEDDVVDVEDDIDIHLEDEVDSEDDINERAERFIADFHQHLRLEQQLDLERQTTRRFL